MVEAARDADIVVHEILIHREIPPVEGLRSAETLDNVAAYHTLSGEVGKVAAQPGAGCLVLTHFAPPGCDRDALLAAVSADFAGPLVLGEDLKTLDAEAGTIAHGKFGPASVVGRDLRG